MVYFDLQEGRAGFTPLHIAAENNNLELTKFLLENNKQLNTEVLCYRPITAYEIAFELGHSEIVDTLIRFGCEVITPNETDDEDFDELINVDANTD